MTDEERERIRQLAAMASIQFPELALCVDNLLADNKALEKRLFDALRRRGFSPVYLDSPDDSDLP